MKHIHVEILTTNQVRTSCLASVEFNLEENRFAVEVVARSSSHCAQFQLSKKPKIQESCDRFGEEAGVVRAGAGLTWGIRFKNTSLVFLSLLGTSSFHW